MKTENLSNFDIQRRDALLGTRESWASDQRRQLRHLCPVVAQRKIAPFHFRLTLENAAIAQAARAGQFVHVLPRTAQEYSPLLRRAFSVAHINGTCFDLIYRVNGRGTAAMSQWRKGIIADVLGPLGQAFAPLGTHSILVGGGVGVPPLALLCAQRDPISQNLTVLIGARTAHDVLCVEDFAHCGASCEIATDDGSAGHHGLVTQLLERHLSTLKQQASSTLITSMSHGETLRVFACGPLPMLRVVATLCARFEVRCQVSLEEAMPCGIGVCNGCVVPVKVTRAAETQFGLELSGSESADEYSRYRRICIDGPVLWAHEVDWND